MLDSNKIVWSIENYATAMIEAYTPQSYTPIAGYGVLVFCCIALEFKGKLLKNVDYKTDIVVSSNCRLANYNGWTLDDIYSFYRNPKEPRNYFEDTKKNIISKIVVWNKREQDHKSLLKEGEVTRGFHSDVNKLWLEDGDDVVIVWSRYSQDCMREEPFRAVIGVTYDDEDNRVITATNTSKVYTSRYGITHSPGHFNFNWSTHKEVYLVLK